MSEKRLAKELVKLLCGCLATAALGSSAIAGNNDGYTAVIHGGDGEVIHGGDGRVIHGGDGEVIHGGDGRVIHGGDGEVIHGGDAFVIHGGDGEVIHGGDAFVIHGGDGEVIHGGDAFVIHGGDGEVIHGGDAFVIHGGDGEVIHGGDGEVIHGGDGDVIHGGDAFVIHGGDGRVIHGGDLLAVGHVDTVADGFISVMGQTVVGEGAEFAGLTSGSTVAIYGSIDAGTGGYTDTSVIYLAPFGVDAGVDDFLKGTVDAVDEVMGVAVVSGVTVDYTALLAARPAPVVGEVVALKGKRYRNLGLFVAVPGR